MFIFVACLDEYANKKCHMHWFLDVYANPVGYTSLHHIDEFLKFFIAFVAC